MIHYRYLTQVQPPAPFLNVTLRNTQTSAEMNNVAAQIDSAADRTLLPVKYVRALNLPQMRVLSIGVVGGEVQELATYPVQLSVHDLPARVIAVGAHPGEAWILLGRDVLNSYRIVLDGPNLSLEIG